MVIYMRVKRAHDGGRSEPAAFSPNRAKGCAAGVVMRAVTSRRGARISRFECV